MSAKRAFILSSLLHLVLWVGLSLGGDWWRSAPKRPPLALEANLLYSEAKNKKDLLPKKSPKKAATEKNAEVKPMVQQEKAPAKPIAKAAAMPRKDIKPEGKVAVAQGKNFAEKLEQLSRGFAADLKSQPPQKMPKDGADEIIGISTSDDYFQHIYGLIKESFVVPPHINGPQGENLSTVLRIFLSQDGTLSRLSLEKPSGDVHFDKAVKEGTMRVNNFGRVPILLQDTLAKNGVVVELCPFKCTDQL